MTIAWISLSTRWSLSSVQAALNVVISVLSTVGIWSLSRFWWQHGSSKILRGNSNVPLSALLSISGPGEGWDVVTVLRKRVFAKENWRLLFQLVIMIAVTAASMLSGPIAKVSLRTSSTMQPSKLEVLQTVKGGGATGNIELANGLWNDTLQSLDQAKFPFNQMLDYLPPSTVTWTYIANEWDPTWSMECSYTPETILHNLTANGNYTFYDPIDAFPGFRETYDQSWLDTSEYRVQADFNSWNNFSNSEYPFSDALFFILIESDPEKGNRMNTNNATLQISLSVLHAVNFSALNYGDATQAGATIWQPIGPVGNASFTRAECNITRKPEVLDEKAIPWLWTNDTYSITAAYSSYWGFQIEEIDSKKIVVPTPTAQELLRFYQAYIVTMNTLNTIDPSLRQVSIWMDTVQLSVAFLAVVVILTALTLWITGRYFWFLKKHNSELEEVYVPDGRTEWMIHAAKASRDEEEGASQEEKLKDRDYLRTASFGYIEASSKSSDPGGVRRPSLARVYTTQNPVASASPSKKGVSLSKAPAKSCAPPLAVRDAKEDKQDSSRNGHDLKRVPSSVDPLSKPELIVTLAGQNPQPQSPQPDEKMLIPEVSRKSSSDGNRSSSTCVTNSPKSSL